MKLILNFLITEPYSEEGWYPTDEPTQVWEDRGHGQHDVSERSLCTAQLEISLLPGDDLCKLLFMKHDDT